MVTIFIWARRGLLLAALFLAGCAAPVSPDATIPAAQQPTQQPTQTVPEASMPESVFEYENPVFERDFPDPFVLPVDGGYYAYATNARHMNIQVIHSADLVTWERVGADGDALPELPEWAAPGEFLTWAPSVLALDGEYILYYVTRFRESGRQCISYAVSVSPDGPFVDSNPAPLICQLDEGGSIDPEPFRDADGSLYLLWKNDGNCCGLPVYLYSQPLSADGRILTGEPQRLIAYDQAWEDPLIENPSMALHEGSYHLIYSANWYEGPNYAVGHALCESALGPCIKPLDRPVLVSAGKSLGPGGASFFRAHDGSQWIAYHAWRFPNVGYPVGARMFHIAQVEFAGDELVFHRPEAE